MEGNMVHQCCENIFNSDKAYELHRKFFHNNENDEVKKVLNFTRNKKTKSDSEQTQEEKAISSLPEGIITKEITMRKDVNIPKKLVEPNSGDERLLLTLELVCKDFSSARNLFSAKENILTSDKTAEVGKMLIVPIEKK